MPTSALPNRIDGGRGFPVGSAQHGFTPLARSAQQGFTLSARSTEHGFTLVELMVVLVLIGLAASVVMLAARGPDAATGDEAARLALRIAGARDRAIVDGRSTRVEFVADGYRFAQRGGGAWVPVADRGLRATTLPGGVTLGASRSMLAFDSGGLPDAPLDAVLRADDARVTLHVDAAGGVDVVR